MKMSKKFKKLAVDGKRGYYIGDVCPKSSKSRVILDRQSLLYNFRPTMTFQLDCFTNGSQTKAGKYGKKSQKWGKNDLNAIISRTHVQKLANYGRFLFSIQCSPIWDQPRLSSSIRLEVTAVKRPKKTLLFFVPTCITKRRPGASNGQQYPLPCWTDQGMDGRTHPHVEMGVPI